MSKSILVRGIVLSVMVAAGGLVSAYARGADSSPIAATMETFSHPEGVHYFALTLKPTAVVPAASSHDVVILFNTAASQVGPSRDKAIQTLRSALAAMPEGDRVQLMAADLDCVPLTKTFVAPKGKEIDQALAALEARTPLGAADVEKSIATVAAALAADTKNQQAIVYIGDGRSAAKLVGVEPFAKLVQALTKAKIPVSSYIIGDRIDFQLPGALAVQTGGAVIVDKPTLDAAEAGRQLAAALDVPVLWIDSVGWPSAMTEVLPKQLPPLRGDRETVVIGTFKGKGPFQVQINATGAGGQQKFDFAVSPKPSDDSNNYLAMLVQAARGDGGLTMPLVGAASLAEAQQAIGAGLNSLGALARQALAAGNLDSAKQLAAELLRRDPNSPEAKALTGVIAKQASGAATKSEKKVVSKTSVAAPAAVPSAKRAGDADDLDLVGPGAAEPPAGTMTEQFEHDRRVVAQMIQAQVRNTADDARKLMSTDPDLAAQNLKLMLETVRRSEDLSPESRDQYAKTLETAIREAARRKIEVDHAKQQRLETMAAGKEQERIANDLSRNQMKVKQLMERFDSLMQEGRYRKADEEAAAEAQKTLPDSPVPTLASEYARVAGNYNFAITKRLEREKNLMEAFNQVEKSLVPFPDDPPIVYPDAEVWQELTARRKAKYSSVDLSNPSAAERKIQEALKSKTKMEFVDTPLNEVIDFLKDYHSIEIQLDNRVLQDASIETTTPVTKNLEGITLRSALRLLLKDLGLTYVVENEVLLITTPEEADNRLSTRVYPVADLVIPIVTPQMTGMGGGMGGGMSGGMGGGMSGGMGGGMGGGSSGGMGMFNVQDLLKRSQANQAAGYQQFQAFSVQDDLSVPAKPESVPAATKKVEPTAASSKVQPVAIPLDGIENAKPNVYWERYFSANEPQAAAVREATRQLMGQHKFDHVIALINAALRHRQGQPWMYEALVLALDAAGQPKSEIERAVMSAVDFAGTPNELMYIGAYLSQAGLHQRALQVYRQVADIDPTRSEPYMLGLRTARTLDDLEGLKWASLGIAGQAWPKEQNDVWEAGIGVAREVLERLRKAGRTEEADKFQAALNRAIARDCVAIVTWTGDADIDVLVEEPSGTVCSLRNPRTTAGGLMLGDALAQTGRDNYGAHSEVYACPKGFSGTYRLLLRRVWGKVTADKVNVEVITHFRGDKTVSIRKNIPLDKNEAMVVFDLADGRRTESLREQQVANAANSQLSLNRQVLNQQINAAISPLAMQDSSESQENAAYLAAAIRSGKYPYLGGGAVGYQPVIIWLPEGTNFMAQAVVSADRRYVRVTTMPLFSAVSQVSTFNYTSGSSSTSSGGSGGSGYSGSF